jgi:hypothetical protein
VVESDRRELAMGSLDDIPHARNDRLGERLRPRGILLVNHPREPVIVKGIITFSKHNY